MQQENQGVQFENDLYAFFCRTHLKNLHFCGKIIKEFFKKGLTAVSKLAIISDSHTDRQDNTVLFLRDYNYEY